MLVIIIGPPGCGKGTVCKKLSKRLGYTHLSTGELLRKEAEKCKEIRDTLSRGEYISDEITTNILLREIQTDKVCLLDGYPRNVQQTKALEDLGPPLVIHLSLEEEKSRERIMCRGENRADDREEVLDKRFELYSTLTQPVVDFYREKGLVVELDASKGKEEVYEEVKKVLEIKGALLD